MKKIAIFCLMIFVISALFSCTAAESHTENEITSIFTGAVSGGMFELFAEEEADGYFTVEGTGNFSLDDVVLKSSDEDVVTIEIEKVEGRKIYYKITAVGAGEAEIYAETISGDVQSDMICVSVSSETVDMPDDIPDDDNIGVKPIIPKAD